MWFLKGGVPNNVDMNVLASSIDKGYQENIIQFRVSGDEGYTVGFTFPWSSNKKDGSLTLITPNTYDTEFELIEDAKTPELQIFRKARELKKNTELDRGTISEIWDCYVNEEYGVFTTEIEPNTWYQLSYTHKISIFSKLFLPTRLSNYHIMSNPTFNLNVWSRNISLRQQELDQIVEKVSNDRYTGSTENKSLKRLMEYDIYFSTSNWESSDDEL